jgi:hypothetical protein
MGGHTRQNHVVEPPGWFESGAARSDDLDQSPIVSNLSVGIVHGQLTHWRFEASYADV